MTSLLILHLPQSLKISPISQFPAAAPHHCQHKLIRDRDSQTQTLCLPSIGDCSRSEFSINGLIMVSNQALIWQTVSWLSLYKETYIFGIKVTQRQTCMLFLSTQEEKARLIQLRLRKDILRQNPARFEIGPVYNTNPRDRKSLHKASSFKPVAKELCFDIDLTDYDDIRTCCKGASICLKCWQFATMAVKVVDACLREDFGFEHIMWVYSGRRGVHGWVCDKRAREMNDEKRRAIAGYLGVVLGSADKKINLRRPLHPHLQYAYLDI